MDDEREMVLRMLKEGKITVEEADALLQELAEQSDEEGAAAPPLPGSPGPDVRQELRSVFQELLEAIPKDVVRELKQAGEALRPGFFQVVRGLRGLTEGRAETTAEEVMRPGEQLVLRNAWGDAALTVSPDDRLRMRAVKRVWIAEPDAAAAQREAEALSVEVRRHGSSIEITVQRPMLPHRRSRVDFELAIPAGVDARADVAKGDVTADGLRGKIDLRVASGDVKIRTQQGGANLDVISGDVQLNAVRGDVRLDVRSGDVAARQVDGALRGRVINGDIALNGVGDLTLDVVHGDVAADGIAGTVRVETKSGDVALAGVVRDARARTLAGDVGLSVDELTDGMLDVETVSGDIEVSLPASARATIEAATRSGAIHSSLPLQQTAGDRRSLRGILNGPGATVRLAAMSGDIELRERRP